jgi:hypothetical protein
MPASVGADRSLGLVSASDAVELDPITHTYRRHGCIVPGVTSVLKNARIVDYSFIPQDVLQRAAHRGSAVHLAAQYCDEGMLDRGSIDPELEGYLQAYERFLEESRFLPLQIEMRVYHEVYHYAGTLDRIGLLNDDLTILDFKTGLVLPGHAIQLAAYANTQPKPRRFRRIALQLNDDATYRVHEYPLTEFQRDVDIFLAALVCSNFIQEHQA